MSKQFTTILFLFSLLTQIALSTNRISLKERKLPAEELNSVQASLGASAFLLGFLIHGMMAESKKEITAEQYNPLFFNIINRFRTNELELLVAYMKTYQKDLNNACRMVFNIQKHEYEPEVLNKLKARCDLWSVQVFKLIPLNYKFFNIEFAFKYFLYLSNSRAIPIDVMLGEASDPDILEELEDEDNRLSELLLIEKAKIVTDTFFTVLGKVINETLAGKDNTIHSKFHLIQRFYGPEFVKIFGQILDDSLRVVRKTVELDEFEQTALDTLFVIRPDKVQEEKQRIERRSYHPNRNDLEIKSVTPDNLYRFYGHSYDKAFNDVSAMYMMDI